MSGGAFVSDPITLRSFPNAVVSRELGVVRDANGDFVTESLGAARFLKLDPSTTSDVESFAVPPDVSAGGNYLYATHGNFTVFSHFLLETMCSVYLTRSLFSVGLLSLLLPESPFTWMDSLLDCMGIPRVARYRLERSRTRFSNLILSSTCSGMNTFRPNPAIKDLARFFLDSYRGKGNQRTRLYLTREGTLNTRRRAYVEETALVSMLKDLGFVAVNPALLPFEEQVRLFSTAEMVVGVHGSAFANLMFAPPGCKVIDIIHDSWAELGGGQFTANLTNLFEQEYAYVIASSSSLGEGVNLSLDPTIVRERVKIFLEG